MAGLKYIGSLHRVRRVRTDEPLQALWQEWLKLSDDQYLKERWIGSTPDQRLAVTTNIRQAHEYRAASKATSLLTRPVLVYYSALNLAKAAIHLKTEAPPPDHHGLMKPEAADDILDIAAKVNNGAFRSLSDLLGMTTTIGQRLTLRNFIGSIVELRCDVSDYFKIRPTITPVYPDIFMDGTIRLLLKPSDLSVATVEEAIEILRKQTTLFDDFHSLRFQDVMLENNKIRADELKSKGAALIEKHLDVSVFEDPRYYVNIAPEEQRIPAAPAYLVALFLLSCLVRYWPAHVQRFITTPETRVAWFVETLCATAERVLPNLLLDLIAGYRTRFVPAGLL
ncbi:MAG TPA: YaaC family protein [Thermoanaerobaculia bacterium]|nr:YaaC family protein [Thermoanaerobaculia bacterium]